MKYNLNFEDLEGSGVFERLCSDLLIEEGARNPRGHGVGTDQGSDFLIDVPQSSPLGLRLVPFLVQCKWWKDSRTVGQSVVSEALAAAPVHRARGILIITSSRFSGTAVTKMNAADRERSGPLVYFWDGDNLSKRIWMHPKVLDRFFGSNAEGLQFSTKRLFDLAVPPLYATCTLGEFPYFNTESVLQDEVRGVKESLQRGDLQAVVLSGGVGAGKSGLATSLAKSSVGEGGEIAFVTSYMYRDFFADFEKRKGDSLLDWLRRLDSADCLILDDFGEYLLGQRETQKLAEKYLVHLIENRRGKNLPTLIAKHWDDKGMGRSISQYLEWLVGEETHIDLGSRSRRCGGVGYQAFDEEGGGIGRHFLGRGWLEEKLDKLRSSMVATRQILLTPDEVHDGRWKRISESWGFEPRTKATEAIEQLEMGIRDASDWHDFIARLDFDMIDFDGEGNAELVNRRR